MTQVWGEYDNGARSQLYLPSGSNVTYFSADPTIVTVDTLGNIRMVAVGSTTVNVSYLGFNAQTSVAVTAPPPPPTIQPLGVVSRKLHRAAGNFDINLPLTGDEGIESRAGGRGGKYQLVATFATPVTIASASITSGTGTVSGFTISDSQVTINLAGVITAQRLTVTLTGVSDGTTTTDVVIPMAVLIGDVTADGIVDPTDFNAVKSAFTQPISIINFRDDVTVDSLIDKRDGNLVRINLGTQLPPQ